jgi:hypothetical protein
MLAAACGPPAGASLKDLGALSEEKFHKIIRSVSSAANGISKYNPTTSSFRSSMTMHCGRLYRMANFVF